MCLLQNLSGPDTGVVVMGEGHSITTQVLWRTVRTRKGLPGEWVDGGPVQLHLVDSNGMGRMTLSRVVMRRTGNNEYNKQREPCLQKQKTSHPR